MKYRTLTFLSLLFALPAMQAADDPPLPPPEATEVWSPVPPIVSADPGRPPSDAIVLFDGSNLNAWVVPETPGWKLEDGAIVAPAKEKTGMLRTREGFGDAQLHLEFRTPAPAAGEGQSRGNSGVYLMGIYEVQVLDSWHNKTYVNGQAAAVYKQYAPLVNASRPPGHWQTYDLVFIAPRFGADGGLLSPARVILFHNGVLVQHDVALRGPTLNRGLPHYTPHAAELPLELQDHKNPVAFRNIWIRRLAPPATADAGWTSLFDGRTLTGWTKHGGGATFEVRDGAIVGRNGPRHNTFLCTDRAYRDFELEFDVKITGSLNSGVQIRSKVRPEEIDGAPAERVYGPQVEIENSPGESGYLYAERADGWMTPDDIRKPLDVFKNDEWNRYRVVAQGPRIQTWINGEPVSDLVDEKIYAAHAEGFIGLQVHQIKEPAGTLEVSWRNLRIREVTPPGS